MKSNRFLHLIAAVACTPLAPVGFAEQPKLSPPGANSGSSSASISTLVTDGTGTITITVEKDGKKEVRTLDLNSGDPAKLAEQLVDEVKSRGGTTPSTKKKMTYLGVMLAESANQPGDVYGLAGRGENNAIGGGSAATKGLPPGTGLTITGVSSGSPAEKAGLRGGDVLAKLDEQILINPSQFTTLIRNRKEGDTIKLALLRNGESKDLDVTLATRDEEDSPAYGIGGASGFGSGGGQGGAGKFFFRPEKEGRVLRLEKDGKILEEWIHGENEQAARLNADKFKKLHEGLPQWEKTLRDAAEVKDKATDQWKKQLAEWRDQWSATQEKTAAEFRRAMEKMGEEIRKATEAAVQAQEAARRAVEESKQKRDEEKRGEEKHSDDKTPPPAEEKKDAEPRN